MSKKAFVGVSAARQGGFSSHVLPAPVEFDPAKVLIIYQQNGIVKFTGGIEPAEFEERELPPALSPSSGGPFDEPYFRVDPAFEGETLPLYRAILSAEDSPGEDDYTLEGWYRVRQSVMEPFPVGNFREIISIFDTSGSFNFYGGYVNLDQNKVYLYAEANVFEFFEEVGISATYEQWRHFAIVRESGLVTAWDNGTRVGSIQAFPINTARLAQFTRRTDNGQVRYIKGQALYSGETIAVPTAPFVAV